jgi:hypothetical protein
MIKRPDIIERRENGERFANASKAGTTNTTTQHVKRPGSTPSCHMNRVLPRTLRWSQYSLSNRLIFASF